MAATALSLISSLIEPAMSVIAYNKRAAMGQGLAYRYNKLPKRVAMGLLSPAGGRLNQRSKYVHHDKIIVNRQMRVGRGRAADIISSIPIIGPLIGSIVRAAGGSVGGRMTNAQRMRIIRSMRRMNGMGLSPMYLKNLNQRAGGRLLLTNGYGIRRGHYRYIHTNKRGGAVKRVHVNAHVVKSYPYRMRNKRGQFIRGGYLPYTF